MNRNFVLPDGWEYKSILDLVDIISGVSYSPEDIIEEGIRIIRGGNIQDNIVLIKEDDVFLPFSYKNNSNSLYKGDVVLVASTGSVEALGRTATIWEDMHNVQIGAFLRILRPKNDKIAPIVSMWLSSSHFLKYIRIVAKGTSINNIGRDHLKNFIIPVPDLNKIESISKIYMDFCRKISLNRSINDELEQIAKEIYDYWFVQFDFPNENGLPYKSSGGKMVFDNSLKREIPEGWSAKKMEDICDIFNGATPSTSVPENYGGSIAWVTPKDLSDQKSKFTFHTERCITKEGYDSCSTHMLPPGSILMSSRAPIGLISIAAINMCTNQGFKSFVPHDITDNAYIYYYLSLFIKQIEQLGTGTTFKEVSREDVANYLILYVSDRELYKKWYSKIKPIFEKQSFLLQEIDELVSQRDELLPLLMTGQVNIQ